MKDTTNYPLIPQTGGHWVFPAVYAADSLFQFMGDLKGIELAKLKIGPLHESDNHGADNDLEQLLNLSLPIRKRNGYRPTAMVIVENDSTQLRPKVLFVGNSFMWGIANQVPMTQVFDNVEFWYYFSTTYIGDPLTPSGPVVDLNLLEKFLDFDYIVWFTTGNQLNKGTMGFAQSAILTLGVDDSIRRAYIDRIADTLCPRRDAINRVSTDSIRRQEAITILYSHPEIIPELDAETLMTQNSEIAYARYTKDIRKDSTWMAALEAQAFLRTASMHQMLHAEVDHIKAGKPLYKDKEAEIRFARQCRQEVQALVKRIPNNEKMMEIVRQQSAEYDKSIEKTIEDNAIWLVRDKYGLHRYRLIDDPDAEIPLPP